MKAKRFLAFAGGFLLAGSALILLAAFLSAQTASAQTDTAAQPFSTMQEPNEALHVFPDPPQAHEPTEIRVILFNDSGAAVQRFAQFYVGPFGIGRERFPIGERQPFMLPPQGEGTTAINWIPPTDEPRCFYVEIFDLPTAQIPIATFQHNVYFQAYPDPGTGPFTEVFSYPLRNPLPSAANIVIEWSTPITPTGWMVRLDPAQLALGPGEAIIASVVFTYTGGVPLPPGGEQIFAIHALANGQPIGGFIKEFGPPVRLHLRPEPAFAESEISVNPYPVRAGEPAEICAEVRNVTRQPRQALVQFAVAPFGIGLPFQPASPPIQVIIPAMGKRHPCIRWVAPQGGQFAFEVRVESPGYPRLVASQRVLDVSELLVPGGISELTFPVRNPFNEVITATLEIHPSPWLDWGFAFTPPVLPFLQPNEIRMVTLTVTVPPGSAMPADGSLVADVQARAGQRIIGGFRKIYRPAVPIHQPGEPVYAESEIKVRPYPPQEREPTEICVEVRNPTLVEQTVMVDFRWAEFGIGLPWHPIRALGPLVIPPQGMALPCTMWIPPHGGRFGFEVGIHLPNQERLFSQRLIDVGEILLPNQPAPFEFIVSNPYPFPIDVTLGAIRYLPQWQVTFNTPELTLPPGASRPVVMTVVPVQNAGDPEPQEGEPVIDVEAYWHGNGQHGLLGGFRKLFFPPVPVHDPQGPPFAEREIDIFPYPPLAGEPTHLVFEARNPTTATQQISVTFEVANLGIGLPFTPVGAATITLLPQHIGVAQIVWIPPAAGEFCVRVRVEAPFFDEPFISSRNISIVRLPHPYGTPEVFTFPVGDNGISTRPLTITLGLDEYLGNWEVALASNEIVLQPGQLFATGVMTITPPVNPHDLPVDGGPIADVSAFVDGELIGGIRKVWRPPVPLGQLGEASYAESEISVDPYPPVAGQPTTFGAQVRNNSAFTQTIQMQFGWANFGVGIPFSNTNVVPTQTVVTLSPYMTTTVNAQWTPDESGHFCVQIKLFNEQTQEALHSQRNVDVVEGPPCEPFTRQFWLYNATPLVVTATLGTTSLNLPAGWEYSVDPSETVLGPFTGITVTVTITPDCGLAAMGGLAAQQAGTTPAKIQVEGYDQNGELIGGIELQFVAAPSYELYLPLILRQSGAGREASGVPIAMPEESSRPWEVRALWLWLLALGGASLGLRRSG